MRLLRVENSIDLKTSFQTQEKQHCHRRPGERDQHTRVVFGKASGAGRSTCGSLLRDLLLAFCSEE